MEPNSCCLISTKRGQIRDKRRLKLCGTNYPTSICFIVVNEFCERFSFYGMKAVLTLYFLTYLHWDKDLSTAIYHAFSSLAYFTPILGALIADSWLGKFKTIIYLSIVYVIGHVVKSVGAIPTVGSSDVHIALSMVGLILIALGTGGIKPCVAAFGGDQFDEHSISERQKFFSIFYMSINAGSLLSTVVTPILRGDVQCFGGDCYALAFGVPAALMVVALVVFIAGSSLYKKSPPQGNILLEVCNCIGFAIKNRWRSSKRGPSRPHWLDWAEEKYSKRLIQEIKMVLRVLVLYIPLPMFWALFDQQGSRWTLQATRMNMAFVRPAFWCQIKSDSIFIIMLNALLILVFVPIFDLIIYPLVRLCRINVTPLRKMAMGMIFAALAFCAATLVEVNVVVRTNALQTFNHTLTDAQDPDEYKMLSLGESSKNLTIEVTYSGHTSECLQKFEQEKTYSLMVFPSEGGVQCQLVVSTAGRSRGFPIKSCLYILPYISLSVSVSSGRYPEVKYSLETEMGSYLDLGLLDFGASYTIILEEKSGTIGVTKIEDVKANNVHIAWQIPQYVLITAGEVMFSITGLEFSYSQAPANMKSVLQAGWLLTVAFGNVIVLIVAEGAGLEQWKEFLLFAGLLLGVCVIFSIMSYFYTYVDPDQLDKIHQEGSGKEEEDDNYTKTIPNEMKLNKRQKSTKL
uniref:Solute carrier family 15 member 2 n=1 Tax=Echeneis naucrates TaxID=173247 RepID=A0A665WN53_ECHNA